MRITGEDVQDEVIQVQDEVVEATRSGATTDSTRAPSRRLGR
ncbi:hypothetical protein [Natronosalvus halobius]|nr:hypothetical protein [Natronosalvus halobius]